jgi:hypothetical protein
LKRWLFILALLVLGIIVDTGRYHPASAQDSTSYTNVSTVRVRGRTSVPALSAANSATFYFDITHEELMVSQNGGAYEQMAGGGGSGSPGGSPGTVQYNAAGSFGGIAGASSNGTAITFTNGDLITNQITTTGGPLTVIDPNMVANAASAISLLDPTGLRGLAVSASLGATANLDTILLATGTSTGQETIDAAGNVTATSFTGTGGGLTGIPESGVTNLVSGLAAKAPLASPTLTGTVTIPTPFTLGAVSVTTTGTQLNYLASATGTTGTASANLVFSTSPTLVTPTLGAATATSINGLTLTSSAGGVFTLAAGKTFTVSNTLTFTGTDTSSVGFGTGGTVLYTTGAGTGLTFPGTLSIASGKTLTASNTLTFTGTDTSSVAFGAGGTVLYTTGSGASLTFPGTLSIASGKTFTVSNTITFTGTDATSFALPAAGTTLAGLGTIETFTAAQTFNSAKLLATLPQFTTGINDANGNPMEQYTATASAVYGFTLTNAALAGSPALSVTSPTAASTTTAGVGFNISASPAVAGTVTAGAATGGFVTITGGAAARLTSGNANGGNVVVVGGAGIGTGTTGILDATGVLQIVAPTGATVANPEYSFSGATNYGFDYAAGDIYVDIAGTNVDLFNSTAILANGLRPFTGPTSNNIGAAGGNAWGDLFLAGTASAHAEYMRVTSATTTITAATGATITATNLIPAGAIVFGVDSRVTTAFTGGTVTALSIGDGTTATQWSNASGITLGTTTNSTNYISTWTPRLYSSATSVVVTSTGTFGTVGVIRVTVYYMITSAPTS